MFFNKIFEPHNQSNKFSPIESTMTTSSKVRMSSLHINKVLKIELGSKLILEKNIKPKYILLPLSFIPISSKPNYFTSFLYKDMNNQINMFINLIFVLLHMTNDNEMTPKKKVYI